MIDNKVVGLAIARMRQAENMTQQTLAACLNVSHQAVSKWENGTALPDVLTLLEITKLFGITMEQLLSGDISTRYGQYAENSEQPIELKLDIDARASDITDDNAQSAAEESVKAAQEASKDSQQAAKDFADAEGVHDAGFDIDKLIRMAPYMSTEALSEFMLEHNEKLTPAQLSKLAPFVTSECLEKLIVNCDNEISWDTLRQLAPFLKSEAVDALTMAVAKGEKYYRPMARAVEKSANELNNAITHSFNKVSNFVRGIADHLNIESAPVSESSAPAKPAAVSARVRIFQRALSEDKFDWIADHMDQLEDQELKTRIYQRAMELGMNDWVAKNMSDIFDKTTLDNAILSGNWDYITEHLESTDDDSRGMIVSTALSEGRWDWIENNIGELAPNRDISDEIVKAAIENGKLEFVSHLLDELSFTDDAINAIVEAALAAGKADIVAGIIDEYPGQCNMNALFDKVVALENESLIAELVEHSDNGGEMCVKLARGGRLALAVKLADDIDIAHLSELIDIATESGDWEIIDRLNDML